MHVGKSTTVEVGYRPRVLLLPRGHLPKSGDIFDGQGLDGGAAGL